MRYNSGTLNRRDQFPPNQLEGAREQGATREGLFYKLNGPRQPLCEAQRSKVGCTRWLGGLLRLLAQRFAISPSWLSDAALACLWFAWTWALSPIDLAHPIFIVIRHQSIVLTFHQR